MTPTVTRKTTAGTVAEFLARQGYCHLYSPRLRDYLLAWPVSVNGVRTFEPQRILEHGDSVRVGADSYTI